MKRKPDFFFFFSSFPSGFQPKVPELNGVLVAESKVRIKKKKGQTCLSSFFIF